MDEKEEKKPTVAKEEPNEFKNLGIPGVLCTYYNEKDRTFHMKFKDGSENLCRVSPEDEMDITVGFMMCLVKKMAKKNKLSVKGLAEKYFRDSKRKKEQKTVEIEEIEEIKVEEVSDETNDIVTSTEENTVSVKTTEEEELVEEVIENETSDEDTETLEEDIPNTVVDETEQLEEEIVNDDSAEVLDEELEDADGEEYRLVEEGLLSDDKIKEILEKFNFVPNDENVNIIRQGYYNIYVNSDFTDYRITAKDGNLIGYTVSYMNNGNMARITVPTKEEAEKYVEWLKSQTGVEGEIKPLYE